MRVYLFCFMASVLDFFFFLGGWGDVAGEGTKLIVTIGGGFEHFCWKQ